MTNPIEASRRKIEFILQDLSTSYAQSGGGGISAIKQTATDTFEVSIQQEERIDLITYELEVDGDAMHIKNRTNDTRTLGQAQM